ncbi:hypothetical protein BDY17DRAFT_313729 [Neohortaea acidophila]|uniref:C2H2-type domain-containing protein n=1 Tax=Neohortaea acidophila TaxID=245834 RepID=A0A6A6PGX1_9PEZI|nr:uncharacterized protein BDY17DRAFT_313729 [Neohortaea acidophila]KAF2479165.1 hypothetical protein BDY17DRAFT_313729 [Neohortaea acidophila]
MLTGTFFVALLATIAAATPQPGNKPVCTTTVGRCTSTVTTTVTRYTGTTTKVHTVTAGTSTTTRTKTVTTASPITITSCAAPASTGPIDKRGNQGENCWSVNTVTHHWATTTTVTVKAVSTVQSTRTVAKTTTTKTKTVTSASTQTSLAKFAGDFYIYDGSGQNAFDVNFVRGGSTDIITLDTTTTFASAFALVNGTLSVVAASFGVGDTIYADPTSASDQGFPDNTLIGLTPADAAAQGGEATAVLCSISQQSDGTCPLTCTGNGGSQFYYCSGGIPLIALGSGGAPGGCDSASEYTTFSTVAAATDHYARGTELKLLMADHLSSGKRAGRSSETDGVCGQTMMPFPEEFPKVTKTAYIVPRPKHVEPNASSDVFTSHSLSHNSTSQSSRCRKPHIPMTSLRGRYDLPDGQDIYEIDLKARRVPRMEWLKLSWPISIPPSILGPSSASASTTRQYASGRNSEIGDNNRARKLCKRVSRLGFTVDSRTRFSSVPACDTGILALAIAHGEAQQRHLPGGLLDVTGLRSATIEGLWDDAMAVRRRDEAPHNPPIQTSRHQEDLPAQLKRRHADNDDARPKRRRVSDGQSASDTIVPTEREIRVDGLRKHRECGGNKAKCRVVQYGIDCESEFTHLTDGDPHYLAKHAKQMYRRAKKDKTSPLRAMLKKFPCPHDCKLFFLTQKLMRLHCFEQHSQNIKCGFAPLGCSEMLQPRKHTPSISSLCTPASCTDSRRMSWTSIALTPSAVTTVFRRLPRNKACACTNN